MPWPFLKWHAARSGRDMPVDSFVGRRLNDVLCMPVLQRLAAKSGKDTYMTTDNLVGIRLIVTLTRQTLQG